MANQFNADEIFTMAEEIEKNGARFYRAAAKNNPAESAFLLNLALMEDEHFVVFEEMHKGFNNNDDTGFFDPDGEACLYLAALADDKVFDVKKDPVASLSGSEPLEEIIRRAIGLEKDSIVFYLGMKELVRAPSGREKVDMIIREEMKHITMLNNKLSIKP